MNNNMTPTPWEKEYDDNGFYVIKADKMPRPYIVATGNESDADGFNADAIVSAVNATYGNGINPEAVKDLYEALVLALQHFDDGHHISPKSAKQRDAIKAAIDKSKL